MLGSSAEVGVIEVFLLTSPLLPLLFSFLPYFLPPPMPHLGNVKPGV